MQYVNLDVFLLNFCMNLMSVATDGLVMEYSQFELPERSCKYREVTVLGTVGTTFHSGNIPEITSLEMIGGQGLPIVQVLLKNFD